MPQPIPIPVQPFDIKEFEFQGQVFSDVQEAWLKTLAWNCLIALALSKRSAKSEAEQLMSLQEEAYLRGRLDFALEILGISEQELFGLSAASSQESEFQVHVESDLL